MSRFNPAVVFNLGKGPFAQRFLEAYKATAAAAVAATAAAAFDRRCTVIAFDTTFADMPSHYLVPVIFGLVREGGLAQEAWPLFRFAVSYRQKAYTQKRKALQQQQQQQRRRRRRLPKKTAVAFDPLVNAFISPRYRTFLENLTPTRGNDSDDDEDADLDIVLEYDPALRRAVAAVALFLFGCRSDCKQDPIQNWHLAASALERDLDADAVRQSVQAAYFLGAPNAVFSRLERLALNLILHQAPGAVGAADAWCRVDWRHTAATATRGVVQMMPEELYMRLRRLLGCKHGFCNRVERIVDSAHIDNGCMVVFYHRPYFCVKANVAAVVKPMRSGVVKLFCAPRAFGEAILYASKETIACWRFVSRLMADNVYVSGAVGVGAERACALRGQNGVLSAVARRAVLVYKVHDCLAPAAAAVAAATGYGVYDRNGMARFSDAPTECDRLFHCFCELFPLVRRWSVAAVALSVLCRTWPRCLDTDRLPADWRQWADGGLDAFAATALAVYKVGQPLVPVVLDALYRVVSNINTPLARRIMLLEALVCDTAVAAAAAVPTAMPQPALGSDPVEAFLSWADEAAAAAAAAAAATFAKQRLGCDDIVLFDAAALSAAAPRPNWQSVPNLLTIASCAATGVESPFPHRLWTSSCRHVLIISIARTKPSAGVIYNGSALLYQELSRFSPMLDPDALLKSFSEARSEKDEAALSLFIERERRRRQQCGGGGGDNKTPVS
jgi:hypothetical protein